MQTKVLTTDELFDDWYLDQKLFESTTIPQNRIIEFDQKRYQALCNQFKSYPANLTQIKNFAYGPKKIKDYNHLAKLAVHLDSPEEFFYLLQKDQVTSKSINDEEQNISLDKLIIKYNSFGRLLHPSKSRKEQNKFLYELANTFFFFAFDQKTFPAFKKFILNDAYYPLARFIYSIIWTHLASKGWSTWHSNTINQLRKLSDEHKEIVYCAGGTDFFHLLAHGIHNVRIIDPFLPSQKKFYSDKWRYLLQGSRDDEIHCIFNHHELTLKRMNVEKNGNFYLGKKKLISYVTTWEIFKKNVLQPCGNIIFERRPIKQADFAHSTKKTLLISFNELYFITRAHDNWGIKLHKLPKQLELFVKQLKKPLNKQALLNMRKADVTETIEFIQLGSSID